ncbi:hypothetical protein EYF80_045372 [Liparis tanakae]|uniref:Uncharacterized protein n=1 Tax=Liparis tanakae TaxID=230148 RepID=A0A4Z2FTB1_9TELE|nr:hypothetical protein EYF80_045372 [Liparis tanakae]
MSCVHPINKRCCFPENRHVGSGSPGTCSSSPGHIPTYLGDRVRKEGLNDGSNRTDTPQKGDEGGGSRGGEGGELEERKCEIGSKSVGKRSSGRTSPQMF